MRPDLQRVWDACYDYGMEPYRIRNNHHFMTRCPVHEGDGHSAIFWLDAEGNIGFNCYAHGCQFKPMMVTLDLLPGDFFVNPYKRGTSHKLPDPSLDDWCLVTARDNRKNGYTLTQKDKEREFEAFMRRRNGIRSPEVA